MELQEKLDGGLEKKKKWWTKLQIVPFIVNLLQCAVLSDYDENASLCNDY